MPNSSGQTLPNLITSRESTPFFLLQLERTTSNEEQNRTKSSTRGRPRSRLAKLKHIDSYDWKHEPRVTAFAVARRVSIEHRRRNRNDFSQRLFDTNRGLRHSDCFSTTPQWPFYPPLSPCLCLSLFSTVNFVPLSSAKSSIALRFGRNSSTFLRRIRSLLVERRLRESPTDPTLAVRLAFYRLICGKLGRKRFKGVHRVRACRDTIAVTVTCSNGCG